MCSHNTCILSPHHDFICNKWVTSWNCLINHGYLYCVPFVTFSVYKYHNLKLKNSNIKNISFYEYEIIFKYKYLKISSNTNHKVLAQ